MKIKNTLYADWHKKTFVIFWLILGFVISCRTTGANLGELYENHDQIILFLKKFIRPDFSYLPKLLKPLLQTLKMSIWGTTLGVFFAIPFSLLGTTLFTQNQWFTSCIRLGLSIIRTVPNLLLAALLVAIIGIGEATGVISIAIFTFGVVSQLLFEAIESIDEEPIEAMVSVGAGRLQVTAFAIIPQVLSQIVSYAFYALEINIRVSTILGFVGAGGIGVVLNASLALFKYGRVSIIALTIFIIVITVDTLSATIRKRLT